MKKLKVKKGSTCMACLACVGACSEAFYKVFDPDKACLQIVEKKAVRPIACPQCGKCAEACPEGAITQNPKGVYMINKKKCTGCGACAKACPFGLIVKTEGNPASKCIACGICAKPVRWMYWKLWTNNDPNSEIPPGSRVSTDPDSLLT